jgi:protein CpxP
MTDRSRQDMQQVYQRLEAARRAQRQAMAATPVDENAIRTAAQDVAAVSADIAVERAKLRAEVFEVLTPEQREQAAKLRAERSDRTGERRARPRERQPRGQV